MLFCISIQTNFLLYEFQLALAIEKILIISCTGNYNPSAKKFLVYLAAFGLGCQYEESFSCGMWGLVH